MIAEVLLVLAGHSSSLFPTDHTINPAFAPLLHPGEQQCLEALGLVALRYRKIKNASNELSRSSSRYVSALCATLKKILKDEYENLVVETEAKILQRDSSLVAGGSYVPISSIRATFAEWDAPLVALGALMEDLQTNQPWRPGPLIDLLLSRSQTGIHRIASIYVRLCEAVQRVWVTQLQAFMIHGSLSDKDPLASSDYSLLEGSMPGCVSAQSRESISYVGRAVGTVKAARWEKQFPRTVAVEHSRLLDSVLPQAQYDFDRVVADIRTSVSEWLWLNVLTYRDVDEALDSLANYFLLRNGEFTLSLIREIERLKISRLTGRAGSSTMIREQDMHLALLRASLGTTAQHDPSLSHLRFKLPSGPLRPLLPSLAATQPHRDAASLSAAATEITAFDDLLLGTPLVLNYTVAWPLDLFLHASDLQVYAALFSYLSALRKSHTRIHTCWASISNAQRARRRWTGLGEGGTVEDLEVRSELLRCGWGVVRAMTWFLGTVLEYVMTDVIDVEFRRLKNLLLDKTGAKPLGRQLTGAQSGQSMRGDGVEPTLSQSSSTATALSASAWRDW
ncbi:gamma-tubulin complex component protein [Cytidiella melzeri]|nr:gamma-tubulin complex component protein [Cytidiella melzeri]